jgi:hypothetical protein
MRIDDQSHSLNFVSIAFDGTLNFLRHISQADYNQLTLSIYLRMRSVKPPFLTEVWSLPGRLEEQPALLQPLLWTLRAVKLVLHIVSFDQVLEDGSRLKDLDTSVWVLEAREAAVRVN